MDVEEMVAKGRDAITVKRVFGQPYERDGVTVIPVAAVGGGGGGGSGRDTEGGEGGGGGFGLGARPVGVYVIKDAEVSWKPATDWTRILLRTQAIGATIVLILRLLASRQRGR